MSARANARVALPAPKPHRPRTPEPGLAERLLLGIGADAGFAEDVLGDLAEERAGRRARHGSARAAAWYLVEVVRAVPHFVWSAARHGSPRARMRLAAFCGATLLAAGAGVALWAILPGAPARLAIGDGPELTINNVGPVRLSARVLDDEGRQLAGKEVRYRWAGGVPAAVWPDGVVKCAERGRSVVRASLDAVSTKVVVNCEPVKSLFLGEQAFFAGDPPRPLVITARDAEGRDVHRIAGEVRVADSTIATVLPNGLIRPLRAGETRLTVAIGDLVDNRRLTVFERVTSFDSLRPDQRWVVAPLHLEPGEVIRWPLPPGRIAIAFGSGVDDARGATPPVGSFGGTGQALPPFVMYVEGPVLCMPNLGPGIPSTGCIARSPEARLVVAHPGGSVRGPIFGAVSLQVFEPGYPPEASRRAAALEKR